MEQSISGETGFIPAGREVTCRNHREVATDSLCDDCGQPYCGDCLVPIQGKRLCGLCKAQAVRDLTRRTMTLDRKADEALAVALIGLLCFPYLFAPLAIIRGVQALRTYRERPHLPGRWKAIAAVWVASLRIVLEIVLRVVDTWGYGL
jgi:hypothetical protein